MEYINKLLQRIPARTKSPTPPSDSSAAKTAEHEVKVRFAREFADVGPITCSAPESLSSASSFHSLNSSLSAKSSPSVFGTDSVPSSPCPTVNSSYANPDISGVDDLIIGCSEIQLNCEDDRSYNHSSQDLSQDQTFASATDELPIDPSSEFSSTDSQNNTQILENNSTTHESRSSIRTPDIQDRPILGTICIREPLPVAVITHTKHNVEPAEEESIDKSISPDKSNDLIDSHRNNSVNSVDEVSLPSPNPEDTHLNSTVCLSHDEEISDVCNQRELIEFSIDELNPPTVTVRGNCNSLVADTSLSDHEGSSSLPSISALAEYAEGVSLPSIPTLSSFTVTDSSGFSGNDSKENKDNAQSLLARCSPPVNTSVTVPSQQIPNKSPIVEAQDKSSSFLVEKVSPSHDTANNGESCSNLNDTPAESPEPLVIEQNLEKTSVVHGDIENNNLVNKVELSPPKEVSLEVNVSPRKEVVEEKLNESSNDKRIDSVEKVEAILEEKKDEEYQEQFSEEKLDKTLTLEDACLNGDTLQDLEQYTEFKPQRQSTSLNALSVDQPGFDDLKSAAEQVANDIFKCSFEATNESDCFVSATSELFQDPKSFDFLIAYGNTKKPAVNRLREESLYVKFDPLVSNTSMLPQGNAQPLNEEQNGKNESAPTNISSPKSNPAIAAIDRLLYFSPIATRTVQKMEEPREKIEQPVEEPKTETPLITDINMSKELELVKATVLQLEEELEKQKKEHDAEMEKQKNGYQEKITMLQAQLAQEVKSKSYTAVVVEEYEKSISRLLTEKERDRTKFEQERAKLQEELQATNVHLTNTEAAFNDVHQKYERLKGVVSAYKNNEAVLKESIQENMETIKSLEQRYEQLKNHATTQLEKANFELDGIRKQHEDETVKLHALVRKAELKSNSLAELVEQKTKENKELTQILDEVIARVGHQNTD